MFLSVTITLVVPFFCTFSTISIWFKLQQALNAAAHVVSDTHRYDQGLSQLLHSRASVARCVWMSRVPTWHHDVLLSTWPSIQYLMDLIECLPVSNASSRQHLQSATWWLLVVPQCWLSIFGPRALSVTGPSFWNSLPDSLQDPALRRDNFRRLLKMHLFTLYWSI